MQRPKYLFHGSGKELIGQELIAKQATDLGENPENLKKGVYASDLREEAIAMGLISCKGVNTASCGIKNGKLDAVIYGGWPSQEYFYLYTLDSASFQELPKGSHQWVSIEPIKPVNVEKLPVKDNLHLIRKATEEEKETHFQKYGQKIEELKKRSEQTY